jgi:hypothetical protein
VRRWIRPGGVFDAIGMVSSSLIAVYPAKIDLAKKLKSDGLNPIFFFRTDNRTLQEIRPLKQPV